MACSMEAHGQNAEGHRHAELQGNPARPSAHSPRRIQSGRSPRDHRAEGDDGVESAALGDLLRHQEVLHCVAYDLLNLSNT